MKLDRDQYGCLILIAILIVVVVFFGIKGIIGMALLLVLLTLYFNNKY